MLFIRVFRQTKFNTGGRWQNKQKQYKQTKGQNTARHGKLSKILTYRKTILSTDVCVNGVYIGHVISGDEQQLCVCNQEVNGNWCVTGGYDGIVAQVSGQM